VGGSIYLMRIAGIDLRMHVTFPLILIWAAIQFGLLLDRGLEGALFGVIVTLVLFFIVVLHELGHALTARRFGVPTKQIVLLPIGGVAQLQRIPEKPIAEFLIAIAGPAVNFALAIILYLIGLAFGFRLGDTLGALQNLGTANFSTLFGYIFIANLFLGVFNLLPAFPMDGGRVLRALLATVLPYTRATQIAVFIGQGMAFLFGLWGFLGGGFFLILIAIFIFMGAGQEGQMVQVRNVLQDVRVGQAFSRQVQAVRVDEPLQRAVDLTLRSFQADFPVIDAENHVVGILTASDLLKALNEHNTAIPVQQVMRGEFMTAAPDDDLFEVQQRMMDASQDAIPVVQGGAFLGMLTLRDLNEVYRLLQINPDILQQRRAGMAEPLRG
jgi:Zn-dependent protease/CBS domain-containing protein